MRWSDDGCTFLVDAKLNKRPRARVTWIAVAQIAETADGTWRVVHVLGVMTHTIRKYKTKKRAQKGAIAGLRSIARWLAPLIEETGK